MVYEIETVDRKLIYRKKIVNVQEEMENNEVIIENEMKSIQNMTVDNRKNITQLLNREILLI